MKKHFASPGKQIIFAWIHVSGDLELVCRSHELSVLLLDLTQQTVKFSRVFPFQQVLHHRPCLAESAKDEIRHGKIVAVIV